MIGNGQTIAPSMRENKVSQAYICEALLGELDNELNAIRERLAIVSIQNPSCQSNQPPSPPQSAIVSAISVLVNKARDIRESIQL